VNVQQFTTDFTFQISPADADGFAFVLQNAGLTAVGANGSGLGYSGIGTSVAVKFDLYNTNGEGNNSTGFYTNGAMPSTPAQDMSASGVNLHSGNTMSAHLVYDGTTLTLTITDLVTTATFTTSAAINIPTTVGGNTAYAGFTGGTGGYTAGQKILSWTYASPFASGTSPTAATPTFSPVAGSYSATQSVTLSDTTPGATIYYTTDGSTPTTASTAYGSAITVSATQTIKAIAVATGYTTSAVASAAYTITGPPAATPTFTPAAGTYSTQQSVTLSDTTAGATIYYTTNGTTPTTASTVYTGAIAINATQTIKAIATASGFSTSAVGSAAYAFKAATPTFTPAAGTYSAQQSVTLSDATTGATIYYTTDGTTPTTASTVYAGPITVNATQTIKALASLTGYTASAVGSATYTMKVATPTFSPAAGTYATTQSVTLSDTTPSATIYYTIDGTTPTTASTVYAGPITVSATQTIKALASATGYTASAVASAAYTISKNPKAAATPTFSPAAGTYTSAQNVTVSDTTAGATIYYTIDGTTPTTASSVYTAPIAVSATQTIKAIATASGFTTSAVGSAAYTINITLPTAATPTFTPAGGSYTTTQTVALSDSTTGAQIYYTTNGSAPTTASTLYSSPITVSSTQTIKAIAAASGYNNSAVASATYSIGTQAVNFGSGFTSSGLNLNGSSAVTGTALVLTDATAQGQLAAAWYSSAVNVQRFTTDFNFQLTAANADGFTFTIQNAGLTAIGAASAGGSGLGYAGIGTSVAVKFDLFNSQGEGSDSTGFYTNGAVPAVPATDMSASGVNLHSGDSMSAHLVYDGTTLTLTITDLVTTATFTTSTTINIPATVGANTAYVGFTAGTGGMTAVQKILNWTYAVN
jgi:hypothetical protein